MYKTTDGGAERHFKVAFTKLYAEKAYEQIKVTDICAKAGYSKATFYLYYESKDELLSRIENDLLSKLAGTFSDFKTNPESAAMMKQGRLPACTYRWFEICNEHRDFLIASFGSHGNPSFMYKFKNMLRPQLSDIWVFDRAPLDQRTRYAIELQIGGIISVLLFHFIEHPEKDVSEIAEVYNALRRFRIWSIEGKSI